VAVTVKQEFACFVNQFLQLPIAGWVRDLESTEILEATRKR